MAKKQQPKKTATEVTPGVETRIVEASLQNPDYGAGRLVPLLEEEGITVTSSAVYTILKRNNLQNKSLRIARLEELRSDGIVDEPVDIAKSAEEPAPVPIHTDEITPDSPLSQAIKSLSNLTGRHLWAYTLPSLLVLGLVAYFLVSAVANFLRAGREPALAPQAALTEATSEGEATFPPLEDYNIISERNLFGGSEGQASAPQDEEVSLEGIPTAEKDLGLKLIGTVAGDDPATSFAIIDNKKTRKQELYHEGDKAGEVLIKRILRNKIIVDAGRGEELLALELEETGKKIDFSPAPQSSGRVRRTASMGKARTFDRAEVEASLQNVDQVIQELNITPFVRAGKPTGFRIGKLPRDSILIAMGLRSGDLITGVNGQDITSPEQAAEFFQTIKQGGDVTIQVRKGRGVRMRGRVIRLKIE